MTFNIGYMSKGIKFEMLNGTKLKIGVVYTRWNAHIVHPLLDGCVSALEKSGVKKKNIKTLEVAGSFELPFAAKHLIESKKKFDAIVVLGCLIKGETMHFEYIADAVAHGLMELNVDEDVPVIFGVLTCLNEAQAKARCTGKNNHGIGWGYTAVEMGLLKRSKI